MNIYIYIVVTYIQVMTSAWSTSEPGPIAISIPEGALSSEKMKEYNLANAGRSLVLSSETASHFMSGESLLVIYEQLYSAAFAQQRAKWLSDTPPHILT